MRILSIMIAALVMVSASVAEEASQAAPRVIIHVDMSALDDGSDPGGRAPGPDGGVIVTIEANALDPVDGSDGLVFESALMPGRHVVKALIPGAGADRRLIIVKDDARGVIEITLRPHLSGLAHHVDDYRLEWARFNNAGVVPATAPTPLRFVDAEGRALPVTRLTDASISLVTDESRALYLSVSKLFTLNASGEIMVSDAGLFRQKVAELIGDDTPPPIARSAFT